MPNPEELESVGYFAHLTVLQGHVIERLQYENAQMRQHFEELQAKEAPVAGGPPAPETTPEPASPPAPATPRRRGRR